MSRVDTNDICLNCYLIILPSQKLYIPLFYYTYYSPLGDDQRTPDLENMCSTEQPGKTNICAYLIKFGKCTSSRIRKTSCLQSLTHKKKY